MPRKRMIDPEFWSDETIGQWSFQGRLFYIALWNFADDEGRFKAHSKLLKAQIFPYDEKITIDILKKEIESKVQWYSTDKQQYGFLRNFLKYQRIDRPSASKIPTPPPLVEGSTNTPRQLDPKLSKVKLSKVNIREDTFEVLWQKYPSKGKLGRKEALRHFTATVKTDEDLENIKKALDSYLQSNRVKGGFVQNGSTWFNNWVDWIKYTEPDKENAAIEQARRIN